MKVKAISLIIIMVIYIYIISHTKKNNFDNEVPKIIHQSAMADKTKWHKTWKSCQQSWKDKFPDFEYKMWHDEDLDDFIKTNYPDFYNNVYSQYDQNIKRYDSARYYILSHFGGIYADMDYECMENFWDIIPQDKVSIAETPPPHFGGTYECALMISPKGHPFWNKVMEKLPDPELMKQYVMNATGPTLLTGVVNENQEQVNALKHQDFSDLDARFTRHHWTGSWNGWNNGHTNKQSFETFVREPYRIV